MPIKVPLPAIIILLLSTAAVAQAPDSADSARKAEQLPIQNPLYSAYKGEVYVSLGITEQRSLQRMTMPAQTVSGVPIPGGSIETRQIEIRTGAEVRYGITDRVGVILSGSYVADRDSSSKATGIFSVSSSPGARSGMTNPSLGIYGRLAGTHRKALYVDIVGFYSPGIRTGDKNQLASPVHTFEPSLVIGQNLGAFTAGLAMTLVYRPETTYENYTYRTTTALGGDAIVQYDFGLLFMNLRSGFYKYVDSTSANDALNGKVRVIVDLGFGAVIGSNAFAQISYGWLLPVSADYSVSGFNSLVEDKGGPFARLSIAARF